LTVSTEQQRSRFVEDEVRRFKYRFGVGSESGKC